MNKEIKERTADYSTRTLIEGLHPVLQRVYLTRQVSSAEQLDRSLKQLPDPNLLSGMEQMVGFLIDAIEYQKRILFIADFDADGATSCAVGIRGLRKLGAQSVDYVVPNRFEFGYGLTPEIVEVAAGRNPDILITVDNGITSLEGVEAARRRGIRVLITDHHLPGEQLPNADAIVNPNLSGDKFPSKALAGVGVIFNILIATRAKLREFDWFSKHGIEEPNLAPLLDLVALGTVADVVPLDHVNRVLVHQGLRRIRAGYCHAGITAMLEVAGRASGSLSAGDLGFAVGPRLNAAGRLDDMSLGIECLLSDDVVEVRKMAARLDALNRERREIETRMSSDAMAFLDKADASLNGKVPAGVCLFDESWHQGVIGILASRIKDRVQRPAIAFALSSDGEIKGSARSIPGVHVRDVLCEVAANNPGLLTRYGGHAMAAGATIAQSDYAKFERAFTGVVEKHIGNADGGQTIYTDGRLEGRDLSLQFAEVLNNAGPWGQAFPQPVFDGEFDVMEARIVGEKHLKLVLNIPSSRQIIDAIAFFIEQPESWLGCTRVRAAYRLEINEYRDIRGPQLVVEHLEDRSYKYGPGCY